MSNLKLQLRYAREVADLDLPCREENFRHGFVDWEIPVSQAALVLVDCWASHQVESVQERSRQIALNTILPTVQACRKAGVTVIHAPSDGWAGNYPRWRNPASVEPIDTPRPAPETWPPPQFAQRLGENSQYVVPRLADEPAFRKWHAVNPLESLRVFDFLGPEETDFMVGDALELGQVCREKKIVHLFYAGFATNICVRFRDYGMHAMKAQGYNAMLLRDCTTGIEFGETVEGMWLTRSAILDIEMKVGPTLTSEQLRQACAACHD